MLKKKSPVNWLGTAQTLAGAFIFARIGERHPPPGSLTPLGRGAKHLRRQCVGGWIILLGHGRVLTPAGSPGRTMERRRGAGTDTREGMGAGPGHSDLWRCF